MRGRHHLDQRRVCVSIIVLTSTVLWLIGGQVGAHMYEYESCGERDKRCSGFFVRYRFSLLPFPLTPKRQYILLLLLQILRLVW